MVRQHGNGGVGDGDARPQHEQGQICARHGRLPRFIVEGNGPVFLIHLAVLDVQVTPSVAELRQNVKVLDSHIATTGLECGSLLPLSAGPACWPYSLPSLGREQARRTKAAASCRTPERLAPWATGRRPLGGLREPRKVVRSRRPCRTLRREREFPESECCPSRARDLRRGRPDAW